ncbi:transmembrane sensor [Pedobacter africanus]|uniref:Ferric-dicitrate binding protein FerR (Iron transport regulator) n=1 Tax=Pedobacter africanus TaxID=151894 RepID=A0ACC6KQZ7_9SPHI|nr:FecR domain-containing protein [Pedobacter africanus]MDR6781574.1 ferric-dicitrate binding protein FerR (iron transport regulator) [Pedobacter africanus]
MMTNDPEKLLSKYNAGLCTEAEKAMVESWYLKLSAEEAAQLDKTSALRNKEAIWKELSANKTRKYSRRLKFAAAAAFLLVGSITALYYRQSETVKSAVSRQVNSTAIVPGGNKAFLTLADGRKISLTDADSGEIAQQEGLSIHKTADGQLVYAVADQKKRDRKGMSAFNTIETPKGGQYQVNLPDGTKVWLNSSSSLRYPTKFENERRVVQLKGEGYFEVAKRKVKFLVETGGQEVEVLGTHFNISSYADEKDIQTTLLEGSVRVNIADGAEKISRLLKPGEQSLVTGSGIVVRDADMEAVMAWKNGDFVFKKEDLKSIMNKIARWYDVEVVYSENLDHLKFGGYVSRSKSISSVLKVMESTGKVKFSIAGKKVIVSRP